MPVSFLSEDQRTRYGHYAGELTAEQLARCFHLNDADRELIAIRRGDHNRLGFALQLCTARFLGTFLEDLQSIPAGVVNNVARQLAIDNPSCYALYCAGEQRWEHAAEIRTRYGYQDFSAGSVQIRLNRWLYALCWTGTDRPSVLFDRATVARNADELRKIGDALSGDRQKVGGRVLATMGVRRCMFIPLWPRLSKSSPFPATKTPQGFRAAQTRFLSYRGFAKPAAADRGVGDRIVAGEFGRLAAETRSRPDRAA
jgi:hypothetical protein